MKIGDRLKNIRKSKNYTLKQLADITNLSIGFLSNIERDINSPSISNLQQICSALGINLMEVIGEESGNTPVTKATEREEIFKNVETSIKIESLLNGKASLNGIAITLQPDNNKFSEMSWGHGYDEIGIVISGELEIELDKVIYNLNEGDSIFIKESTPHRYRNPSIDSTSVVYWFSSKK